MLSNIDISSILIPVISAAITSIISVYISKKQINHPYIMERHMKLISPLYFLLEPYLYKKKGYQEIMKKAISLIQENLIYVDGELLAVYRYYQANSSSDNYFYFCKTIIRMYDHSCRMLGLKRRNIIYKYIRNQYPNKFVRVKALVFSLIFLVLLIFAILAVVLMLLNFFYNNMPNYLFFALTGILISIVIYLFFRFASYLYGN